MTRKTDAKPSGIARIIYKEIVSGDRRKFEARSNDSPTGGGARDLRFSPYERFVTVFERMFPHVNERGVRVGRFFWVEGTHTVSREAYFHPPTSSRANEGRLANVDKVLPVDQLPDTASGRAILLLIQRKDGTVWPHFTTENSLRSDEWNEQVRDQILACIQAMRTSKVAVSGYIDFETEGTYCNGR